VIRLVPPHEGCRLPSRIGAPPVASWLAPNGDDLPPSLHEHYTRFVTTTGQSAPLRRIGTFGLAVGAACALYGAFGVKQRSNPTNPNLAEPTTKNLRAAAHTLGLQLHILNASTDRDFDTVFAT